MVSYKPKSAFPSPNSALEPGLSARDYFAAHAPEMPQWYIDKKVFAHTAKEKLAVLVSWRWDYADAMIAGRGE